MSGCPGCFESSQGQNIGLSNIRKLACDYAKKNTVAVAIIKEAGEYGFLEAAIAHANHCHVEEYISQYCGATPVPVH